MIFEAISFQTIRNSHFFHIGLLQVVWSGHGRVPGVKRVAVGHHDENFRYARSAKFYLLQAQMNRIDRFGRVAQKGQVLHRIINSFIGLIGL